MNKFSTWILKYKLLIGIALLATILVLVFSIIYISSYASNSKLYFTETSDKPVYIKGKDTINGLTDGFIEIVIDRSNRKLATFKDDGEGKPIVKDSGYLKFNVKYKPLAGAILSNVMLTPLADSNWTSLRVLGSSTSLGVTSTSTARITWDFDTFKIKGPWPIFEEKAVIYFMVEYSAQGSTVGGAANRVSYFKVPNKLINYIAD